MYATINDLQNYLGLADPSSLPPDTERLLQRASDLIDFKTFGNAVLNPEKAKTATCAQVEYWLEIDESSDITGPLGEIHIDTLSTNSKFAVLAPRARRYLHFAGLLKAGVNMQ
ncbi:MAG TPA: hypothetical protein VHY08_20785 [Bacillota bacterium]|nr:hypothetical protein [Bacillota bacterium]